MTNTSSNPVPVPPQNEPFPVLWLFVHNIAEAEQPFFGVLQSRLVALREYLRRPEGDLEAGEVHRLFRSVRTAYTSLQELNLWGNANQERAAMGLFEEEILRAFPLPQPPTGSSKPSPLH